MRHAGRGQGSGYRRRQQRADAHGSTRFSVQSAELAVCAEAAVRRVDVLEDLPDGQLGRRQLVRIGREHVHRRAERFPGLACDGHHEPPLVTVPLPLLAVVGAAVAAATLPLL